jgi:catechol 2,3-dioxygenase-like lactoylglutathione lyase family enzyme
MTSEFTIQILPCRKIDDVLDFYVALGFEITYRQERPNTYACIKRGGIELHFFSMKEYEPENSYSTCLVVVPDADALYGIFRAAIRAKYGKYLVSGIPRLLNLYDRPEGSRGFNMVDPGGNWIRFTQPAAPRPLDALNIPQSALSKALSAAQILAESHGDTGLAIRTLDVALGKHPDAPAVHRAQALISRAAMALTVDDTTTAKRLLAKARLVPLAAEEQAALAGEFRRAAEIESAIAD